jgi:hypothetical protein
MLEPYLSLSDGIIYIVSICLILPNRKSRHRSIFAKANRQMVYTGIFSNLPGNMYMERHFQIENVGLIAALRVLLTSFLTVHRGGCLRLTRSEFSELQPRNFQNRRKYCIWLLCSEASERNKLPTPPELIVGESRHPLSISSPMSMN